MLVVIFDRQHRVLLLQRDDDPNFWQSVTGTLEDGETPVQTALREVEEETGINLTDLGHPLLDRRQVNQYEIRSSWLHRYAPGTKINTEYVFSVQVTGDEPISLTEHLSYEWLPKSEAMQRVWSPSNKQAIEKFVPDC